MMAYLDPSIRISVLRRDKHTCQKCGVKQHYGGKKILQIHHKVPKQSTVDDSLKLNEDNLITLCTWCHKKEHQKTKKYLKK